MKKDIIIFGAGKYGRMALHKYRGRVDYFIDNNENLWGHTIEGLEIKSVKMGVMDNFQTHTVIIASRMRSVRSAMEKQLKDLGVDKYSFYPNDIMAAYEIDELVIDPYKNNYNMDLTEDEWNMSVRRSNIVDEINSMVEQLQGKEVMFDHVEIETINRCNGGCSFCPVNRQNDTREYREMSDELFKKIIGQLAELNFSGRLALFSNNEPFLDKDILRRHKYAREKLPSARMHLCTNGTLLTIERFKELMLYLDELIIDNYRQDLKLIKPCQEIADYCETHTELKKRVTIVLRKPQEILTSRGGDAPNRKEKISFGDDRCVLPYKQLIIRPDGKVSLCCNDPLGRNTLGDLTKESIMDVWNGQKFKIVRKALYEGRKDWKHCEYCDNFSLG